MFFSRRSQKRYYEYVAEGLRLSIILFFFLVTILEIRSRCFSYFVKIDLFLFVRKYKLKFKSPRFQMRGHTNNNILEIKFLLHMVGGRIEQLRTLQNRRLNRRTGAAAEDRARMLNQKVAELITVGGNKQKTELRKKYVPPLVVCKHHFYSHSYLETGIKTGIKTDGK